MVTLNNVANAFSGNIVVSGGTLVATVGNQTANPTATALGAFSAPGRTITINPGAVLDYAANNVTGGGATVYLPNVTINQGTLTTTVGNRSNYIGQLLTLNGGTLTGTGGDNATNPQWNFSLAPPSPRAP